MSLTDYLQILRRRKWLVLAVIVAIPAVAVAYSLKQDPSYRAGAQVLLSRQDVAATLSGAQDTGSTQDPGRYATTQAELALVPASRQGPSSALEASPSGRSTAW